MEYDKMQKEFGEFLLKVIFSNLKNDNRKIGAQSHLSQKFNLGKTSPSICSEIQKLKKVQHD